MNQSSSDPPKCPVCHTPSQKEGQPCKKCSFWLKNTINAQKDIWIVNGKAYRCSKDKFSDPTAPAQKPTYALHRDGSVSRFYQTTLLGTVPFIFKNALCDNTRWISRANYGIIKRTAPFSCQRKGCFDRYTCYWYDPASNEKEGAWNEVPDNYTQGDEQCPIYINKTTL